MTLMFAIVCATVTICINVLVWRWVLAYRGLVYALAHPDVRSVCDDSPEELRRNFEAKRVSVPTPAGCVCLAFILSAASTALAAAAWESESRGGRFDLMLLTSLEPVLMAVAIGGHVLLWAPLYLCARKLEAERNALERSLGTRRPHAIGERGFEWSVLHFFILASAANAVTRTTNLSQQWALTLSLCTCALYVMVVLWSQRDFRRAEKLRFLVCPRCYSRLKGAPAHSELADGAPAPTELVCTKCNIGFPTPKVYVMWGVTNAGLPLKADRVRRTWNLVSGAFVCAAVTGSTLLFPSPASTIVMLVCIMLWPLSWIGRLVYWRVKFNRARTREFLVCPVCEYDLPPLPDMRDPAFTCSECGFHAPYADLVGLWSSESVQAA